MNRRVHDEPEGSLISFTTAALGAHLGICQFWRLEVWRGGLRCPPAFTLECQQQNIRSVNAIVDIERRTGLNHPGSGERTAVADP